MITTLHIKNIGIIDDITINLNEGFNVLTGETGAGKTLIIDSLNILAGARFSKEIIRKGEEYSFIEMCLYLPNNPLSVDGNIIISREIHINGRNLCKINGRMVTVNELRLFMQDIIDIHGQYDNQTLMNVESHIELLDDFAGEGLKGLKNKYKNLYATFNEIKRKIKDNYGDEKEKQRRLDLLKYQLNEIESANLKIGEDEELEAKRRIISNSEKISENLNIADMQISECTIDAISTSIRAIEKIENIDSNYLNLLSELKNVYYELQEIGREITDYKDENYFDEEERSQLEERIDTIYSLKRKYGNNIEEILKYKEEVLEEINKIENIEEYITKLKSELKQTEIQMKDICIELNKIRNDMAEVISNKVNEELKDLEMKNATFKVSVEFNESNYNENGLNQVEFLICTNIGQDMQPLSKIASGGEISRIMLAIKTVLADVDKVPVLVFDEIDTGISGIAAKAVATKIKTISKHHQVLCVTHLASIAAKGDYNYFISKSTINEKTKTSVKLLTEEETINEIARIASGEITNVALQHARELRIG